MDEAQEKLLEDILSELRVFNDNYSKELARAENERNNQAIEDRNNAEILAEVEREALELADQQTQEELEKKYIEAERFEKIESYFEANLIVGEANQELFDNVILALESIDHSDQEIVLSDISHKLSELIEQTEVTDSQVEVAEVSHFTDLSLIVFLLGFIPCYLAYKGLSKLFDSAFA